MNGVQVTLEIVLVVLLGATLFHALRLERALGVLKRDRATLEELVSGFNGATRQAQQGIDRLQVAAEGAGRQIARQIETVASLKEDLQFLIDRGDRLADRMDGLVRNGRAVGDHALDLPTDRLFQTELPRSRAAAPAPAEAAADPSAGFDRPWTPPPDLARALSGVRESVGEGRPRGAPAELAEASATDRGGAEKATEAAPRMRSQAERDLLKALRMAR